LSDRERAGFLLVLVTVRHYGNLVSWFESWRVRQRLEPQTS
jgi:hypothetical protein